MLDLEFDGIPHGALVDARNAARVHASVIRRMRREADPSPRPTEQIVEVPPVTSFAEKLRRAMELRSLGESDTEQGL
jgi:hypothetical protein